MPENIFDTKTKQLTLDDYLKLSENGRENLGKDVPVLVYRLFLYSMREQLDAAFGKEKMIDVFRKSGFSSGEYFANNLLDLNLDLNAFIAHLQEKLEALKIGILRIEKFDKDTGRMVLTISEDIDCSGMPLLGETVCNYDEGFISGILSVYTKKTYQAIEIDCWATGDRVCRFDANVLSD